MILKFHLNVEVLKNYWAGNMSCLSFQFRFRARARQGGNKIYRKELGYLQKKNQKYYYYYINNIYVIY